MNISRGKAKARIEAKSHSDIVLEKAKLAFNAYDRNRDGYLTKAEMKRTSKSMTDAQIGQVSHPLQLFSIIFGRFWSN